MSATPSRSEIPQAAPIRNNGFWIAMGFAVAVASGGYFALGHGGVSAEPPFIDEQAILAQTYYFRLAYDGRLDHPDWIDWAAFDHQPLYKYLIGGALWGLVGPDSVPENLQPWRRWMTNPTPPALDNALLVARWTMLCGAVFACVMVYLLGCMVRGPIVGALAAILYATSPLVFMHSRRAMTDVLCQGLVVACMVCMIWIFRSEPHQPWSRWTRSILAGCLAALAANTKWIGAVPLIAFLLVWIVALAIRRRATLAPSCVVALIASSMLLFFGLDPYYWSRPTLPPLTVSPFFGMGWQTHPATARASMSIEPYDATTGIVTWDVPASPKRVLSGNQWSAFQRLAAAMPWTRLKYALDYRQGTLASAPQQFPNDALRTPLERLAAIVFQGMGRWTAGARSWNEPEARKPRAQRGQWDDLLRAAVFAALAAFAATLAAVWGWRQLREGAAPWAWLFVAWPLVDSLLLMKNLTLDWDRYYFGVVTWSSFLAAWGAVELVQYLRTRIGRLHSAAKPQSK